MKKLILVTLLSLAVMGCVVALAADAEEVAPDGSITKRFDAESVAACRNGGGCVLITNEDMRMAVQKAYAVGLRDGQKTCGHTL